MSRKGGTSTHTSFYKGAKVRVILRSGTVIIGKFIEKKSEKVIVLEYDGMKHQIRTADLSSANYYKPLPHELHAQNTSCAQA